MKVKAWLQIGIERRETIIDIPDDELRKVARQDGSLESAIEGYVIDWMQHQYGWGWSGGGIENDFGHMEGSDAVGYVVTRESSIPHTRAIRMGIRVPHAVDPLN